MSKKTAKDHLFAYLDGLTAGSVFFPDGNCTMKCMR